CPAGTGRRRTDRALHVLVAGAEGGCRHLGLMRLHGYSAVIVSPLVTASSPGGSMQSTVTAGEPWPRPAIAWYAVAILVIAFIFSFIDRIIIAMLVDPLKQD